MAEIRNVIESARIAIGALSTCTSTPATPGPAMPATELLTSNLLLALSSWSRPTRDGMKDW